MATGTIYTPTTLDLDPSRVQGNGQGVSATVAAGVGTTTNLDLSLSDDCIITGLELIVQNATMGDSIALQVLAGASVVGNPLPGPWYVPATGDSNFDFVIPQKIVGGLKLRAIYTNSSLLGTPFVAINYKLWKVLT